MQPILCVLATAALLVPAGPREEGAAGSARLAGAWDGAISVAGQTIPFSVEFSERDAAASATIDIQGASGLALEAVRFEPPAVHFELPAGAGRAVFEGELDEDAIRGSFQQGLARGSFELERVGAEEVPYLQEDVRFASGEVELAGTLTVPEGEGPFPAVVLISGSGPQDRDEQIFGFRPFRILADRLTRDGVAVLRTDDRGVGGSGGDVAQCTTTELAGDVAAGVALLAADARIDARRIGLVGHSEGGVIAPMLAARGGEPRVAFVVLLAGTALPGDRILLLQKERLLQAVDADAERIDLGRRVQEAIFRSLRTDQGWEEARALIMEETRAAVPPLQRLALGDFDAFLERTTDQAIAQVSTPWFRFFIDHDPAGDLARVTCPVLALFGGLDLQVPAEENARALREALARAENEDVTVRTFPAANHLFQHAAIGTVEEYAALPKEFEAGVLDLVSSWILERTR